VTPLFTELPGWPFAMAVPARGDCAFVSMPRAERKGVVALSRHAPWRVEQVAWLSGSVVPRGMALDRCARHLLVANEEGGLLVMDAHRLRSGSGEALVGEISAGGTGSMQVALDASERFAFVTNENSASLSVFDFGGSLEGGTPHASLVGQVSLPPGPVGVVISPDGDHLFVTSQANSQGRQPGVLSALRVAHAVEDPRRTAVISVPAGRSPVRVAFSPAGDVAWVTARASNSLLAFDTERLIAGRGRALRAVVRVGAAPTGLAVLRTGSLVVVANSNRYAGGDQPSTLAVVDVGAALKGRRALVGMIPAGVWPREVVAHPDGQTVLVTNVLSKTLETVAL
jgi:DNA-binding beta-propeller fold protein YncE